MRYVKTGVACAGVVAAIGAAAGLLVSAGAPGAIAGNVSPMPAKSSLEAQGAIARTGLVSRLEAGLGDAFGGVWFDADSAQLHVGVTSPASHQAAEGIAARAGLTANVTETPVRWTWAELIAAQQRWNDRLADLLGRGEASTWRAADRNSVLVELGSSVPVAEREALEREAAASDVGVAVVVAPYPKFEVELQASRCKEFEKDEGFCDPTIVAGMTIKSEVISKKFTLCTAGPAVILEDLTKETTETFLLTAGHCIRDWGKVGGKWYAFDKSGKETEIGKAVEYLAKPGKLDVGVIEINTSSWANKTLTPVVPTIAPWDVKPEPEPFVVTGPAIPILGAESCISGEFSGRHCGKIDKTGVTIESLEEVVEVDNPQAVQDGDSGGPWSSKASPASVEGTHIGENKGTTNAFFEPLTFAFAQLATKLQLLTQATEARPACPMKDQKCWLQAESYPVTYDGTSEAGKEKFTTEAGTIKCAGSFHGDSSTGTLHPTYSQCVGFGLGATVKTEGCNYRINVKAKLAENEFSALTDVECSGGSAIKFAGLTCEFEVGPQTGLGTLKLKNDPTAMPKKDITVTQEITGIAYTVTKDGAFCPFAGIGKKANGSYTTTSPLTITGQKPTEPGTKIGIEAGL